MAATPRSPHATPAITPAHVDYTAEGTPRSAEYGDVYHTRSGALGQARHVFLAGNGLLGETPRWRGRPRFTLLETGFGLGLNFLATWQAWQNDPQRPARLHYIACEKHPVDVDELRRLHAAWPELAPYSEELLALWPPLLPGFHQLQLAGGQITLLLLWGDASQQLRQLRAQVDACYLDGFSPAKNPELWSPRIYSSLARLAVSGATLATWTVAASVRKGLTDCGFVLEKAPGYAGKRDMLRGWFRPQRRAPRLPKRREAIILGAGLAGSAVAERLAARGWRLQLFEAAPGPAQGASGNKSAILRPLPSPDDNLLARITRAGFLQLRRHLDELKRSGQVVHEDACGVLHLARDPQHEASQRALVSAGWLPADYLRFVDAEEASRLAGWPLPLGGWWFADGGWLSPASLCAANLARAGQKLSCHYGQQVASLRYRQGQWQALDAKGQPLASAPTLILANAHGALPLLAHLEIDDAAHVQTPPLTLPLRPARGQLSQLPQGSLSAPDCVVCRLGHVTPGIDGERHVGASFLIDDDDTRLRAADHADNLARLEFCLPGSLKSLQQSWPQLLELDGATQSPSPLSGRAGVRCMTPDRLPLVGALPQPGPDTSANPPTNLERIARLPGLYALLGFGARGLVWSMIAAELLAAQLEDEPLPLAADLVQALDPARFMLRRARAAYQKMPDRDG